MLSIDHAGELFDEMSNSYTSSNGVMNNTTISCSFTKNNCSWIDLANYGHTLEVVGNFKQSINKWNIPVQSIVYLLLWTMQIEFCVHNSTRESRIKTHNTCLWLVPSHFQQIKISYTSLFALLCIYSITSFLVVYISNSHLLWIFTMQIYYF